MFEGMLWELFRFYDDELLPDIHITRAGVLRADLQAHREHAVHQDAHQMMNDSCENLDSGKATAPKLGCYLKYALH